MDSSQTAAESVGISLLMHLQERRSLCPPGATSSVFWGHGALVLGNLRVGRDPGDGLSTPGLVTAPGCTRGPCVCPGTQGLSLVQSLNRDRLFVTPWTAARQASLSIANSRSLLRLLSIKSVMPSNHLIHCCPLFLSPSIFPSIRVFSNESVLCIKCQSIGVSASTSVL